MVRGRKTLIISTDEYRRTIGTLIEYNIIHIIMVGTAICSKFCNDKSLDRKYDYSMYSIYVCIEGTYIVYIYIL